MPDIPRPPTFITVLACLFLLGVAVLGGCSGPEVGAELQEYRSRLERTLDVATPEIDRPELPVPPRAESLQRDLDRSAIDGMDFLQLRGCALQTTVARRNSSLGRVAPPSQRLLLELAFLREAPACIDALEEQGRQELAATLTRARDAKTQQLPLLIFNATLGSAEYRDFWRSPGLSADYPERTGSTVLTALESITDDARRWLGGDFQADELRLERSLAQIARGDGGELLRAAHLQATELARADAVIDAKGTDAPFCTPLITPSAAPTLRNVVRTFFVAKVQPYGAAINARRREIMLPLGQLEDLLRNALPRAYARWQQARDRTLEETSAAPIRHVRQLQALLGSCYEEFAAP